MKVVQEAAELRLMHRECKLYSVSSFPQHLCEFSCISANLFVFGLLLLFFFIYNARKYFLSPIV